MALRLEVKIEGDANGLNKAISDASNQLGRFSQNLQRSFSGSFNQNINRAESGLREVSSAAKNTNTTFSDSAQEIARWEKSIGRSGRAAENWSHQIVRDVNAVRPPIASVSNSLERASADLRRGFGRGVIHPSLQNDLRLLDNRLRQVSVDANRAAVSMQRGIGKQGAAGIRGGTSAAISFGQVIQDLPFGINGVANNITQLTTQLGFMATSARAAGVSMRSALIASIANPATIAVLAMSAITSGMLIFERRSRSTKEAVDELGDSIRETIDSLSGFERAQINAANTSADESSRLRILWRVINDVNTSTRDRNRAIRELQREFPAYFGNLSREQILTNEGAIAYDRLAESIAAAARARAGEEQITALQKQLNDNRRVLEIDQDRLRSVNEQIEAQQALIREIRSGAIDAASTIQQERELRDLLTQRSELESRIVDIKARNIPLLGSQKRLEDDITKSLQDQRSVTDEQTVLDRFLGAEKAEKDVKNTRNEIQKIGTDLQSIGADFSEIFVKGAKSFRDEYIKAASEILQRLSGPEFLEVFQAAQRGPSVPTVQPNLEPITKELNVLESSAAEFSVLMSNAIAGIARDFTRTFRSLASETGATFGSVFNGVINAIGISVTDVLVSGLADQLKDVITDFGTGMSKATQGILAGVGLLGGLLQNAGRGGQIAGGGLQGAAAGAAIGSVVPGIGTAIGAAVGGLAGLLGGIFGSNKKQEQLEQQQLDEMRRATAFSQEIIGKMVEGIGVVEGITLDEFGRLTARVRGKDLEFTLDQAQASGLRGL